MKIPLRFFFGYNTAMQKYIAIILSHTSANEFNRIYSMYTMEAGLVRAAGKGVRKANAKLAGHLEPATLSEVYVARSKGMGQITGAIALENFENIKNDFRKLSEVLKIFRFFLKNFSEGEKDKGIFALLEDFLSSFAKASEDKERILVEAFWWKLFDALGNRPEVIKCISCKAKLAEGSRKFFKIEKGGIICQKCASNFRDAPLVGDNQIKLLRIFWGNSLEKTAKVKISGHEVEKLAKIREVYAGYHFF